MEKFIVIENFFDEIDCELKAYMLGYFLADGYISEERPGTYRFGLNCSIDDKETLELFSKFIFENQKKLSYYHRKNEKINRKPQVSIRWISKVMFETMRKFNIKLRKTEDIEFEFNFNLIPQEHQRHFIRGFFDGDGCVSLNAQHSFDWSFIFTSQKFCKQIASILENKLYGLNQHILSQKQKNMTTYMLRFNSNRMKTFYSKLFYDYLYLGSNYFLSRKKKKFEDFFEYRGILEWALKCQVTVERRS